MGDDFENIDEAEETVKLQAGNCRCRVSTKLPTIGGQQLARRAGLATRGLGTTLVSRVLEARFQLAFLSVASEGCALEQEWLFSAACKFFSLSEAAIKIPHPGHHDSISDELIAETMCRN